MSHVNILWHYVAHRIEDISSLSTLEFIRLVATYNQSKSGKADIDPSLLSRGYSPEAIEQAKKITELKFNPVTTMGLRFTRPLTNFKSDMIGYAWTLFENYERGLLPFPGSVSEQPAQIMEIFGVFNALRLETLEVERKRIEKNVGNKRQGGSRTRR